MLELFRSKSRALTVRREPVLPAWIKPEPAAPKAAAEPLTAEQFAEIFLSPPAFGHIRVDESVALQVSAVFGCVGLISRTIAALPWKVMTKEGDFDVEARDHPYWDMLHSAPNGYQTSSVYREQLLNRCLLHGQGYSYLPMNGRGQTVSIEPRAGYEVQVEFDGRKKIFTVSDPAGGAARTIPAIRMIDLPHFALNTARAVDTISGAARNAIGLARMLEEYQGRQTAQGAHPGGFIKQESGKMERAAVQHMLRTWNETHGGVTNAGRWFYLDKDKSATPFEVKNRDQQTLETRQNQAVEICTYYGVPPHMIGLTEKTTSWGTGVEEQMLGFLKFTLAPILIKIEQEFDAKLFAGTPYFNKFEVDGLLRGDAASRKDFLTGMVSGGVYKPNEARKKEGLPPDPTGNVLYQPSGTQVLGQAEPAANPTPPDEAATQEEI